MAAKSRFRSTKNRGRKDIGQVEIYSMAMDETFEVDIPVPVGRMWSTMALDMLSVVSKFSEQMDSMEDTNGVMESMNERQKNHHMMGQQRIMLDAIRDMFGEDQWWDVLMPAAFGAMDNKEDTEFLQENFTMMELINAFFEAAGRIATVALGGKATQEALGKSPDAEVIVEGKVAPPAT